MAGRGKGRGPRPRNPEDWDPSWGGGGGGWGYYPHPERPPPFFGPPPPQQYGFFPNEAQAPHPPPFQGYNRQYDAPRPRGGGNMKRGRGRQTPPGRQPQAPAPNQPGGGGGQIAPAQNAEVGHTGGHGLQVGSSSGAGSESNLLFVCFNCGEMGHTSLTCESPKVCFICHNSDHVVKHCPEWTKPPMAGQYYGSANIGLGFFHIDVEARENRFSHWQGLDNFGVISIVKGVIDEAALVDNLKALFDQSWSWQLNKTHENRFITRFPPSRKVENLVIGKASLFDLNQPGVVASLSVWNGDIEPIGKLTQVWVQISGIPPKWVDWNTVREVSSSIGLIIEMDWQALFSSFFSVVRVKVLCKNPAKVPRKRIYAFRQNLHEIFFKTEGFSQSDPEDGDLGDEGIETIDPEDEIPDLGGENQDGKGAEASNASENGATNIGNKDGGSASPKAKSARRALFPEDETSAALVEKVGLQGIELLAAMELEDPVTEDPELEESFEAELSQEDDLQDRNQISSDEVAKIQDKIVEDTATKSTEQLPNSSTQVGGGEDEENQVQSKKAIKKQKLGPIVPTRRSSRAADNGKTVTANAQEIKRKWNLDDAADGETAYESRDEGNGDRPKKKRSRHPRDEDGSSGNELEERKNTCYDESSRTEMDSLQSQGTSTVVHSEGAFSVPATLGLHNLQKLQMVLEKLKLRVPNDVGSEISEVLIEVGKLDELDKFPDEVDRLYNKHVTSKIGSCDPSKIILNINDFTVYEDTFVDAFKPQGEMVTVILDIRSSLWNTKSLWNIKYHDCIYLYQECVTDLDKGSDKYLSRHLTKKKLQHIKLIFVPILHGRHCCLIVANFTSGSFDYFNSLPGATEPEYVRNVVENLRNYLSKQGIIAKYWAFSSVPVKKQENCYDSGYHSMLHMKNYGKPGVHEIDAEMVFMYRKNLAVKLLFHPDNKVENKINTNHIRMATMEQQKTDENMLELVGEHKRVKQAERILMLQQDLDAKEKLELEIQTMKGKLEVMRHMPREQDSESKMDKLTEELKEKVAESEEIEALNC